ncbi:MAG TPA: 3-hydroxyacyl-CoA dehydrogenase family protein [Chitinophagaceae bacterium]|nr:3-hydroxyacyl-CoA dehydrogenase family protein [Chitinophagaceae bacterium]
MKLAVIASEEQKKILLAAGTVTTAEVLWMTAPAVANDINGYIDLLYNGQPERAKALAENENTLVIINAVDKTLAGFPSNIVRINGWPGFIDRPVLEAAGENEEMRKKTGEIFSIFNKQILWSPDRPGLISARVICTVINEAYLSLEENVSTKEAIDTAMKLGTNYPFGPFEWCEKIGRKNVVGLLKEMSKESDRYNPSGLLTAEAVTE